MPTDDVQIHHWFDTYQKPDGAIEVEAESLNPEESRHRTQM